MAEGSVAVFGAVFYHSITMPQPSTVFIDIDQEDEAFVKGLIPWAVCHVGKADPTSIVRDAKGAEMLSVSYRTALPKEVLEKLPALKLLCTRSVGYDNVDLDACKARGIIVCNVPDYGAHVIAEHAFALLLSTVRHIPEGHRRVLDGTFDFHGLRGIALKGKTMGVLGTGRIGQESARIAAGFGMRVLAHDIRQVPAIVEKFGVTYVELSQLLAESDIITVHVPALPETQHMLNRERFAEMKPGVVLINTARGSVIDSNALLDALNARIVQYALLDVLEHEADVEQDQALIRHPRVITTPHIAHYADDSVRKRFEDSALSIREWMEGKKPTHAVEG